MKRRFLVGIGACLIVLIGVLVLIYPKERIAREVADLITAQTGAEIDPGQTSLRLFPSIHLQLAGVIVSGTGEALYKIGGTPNTIEAYHLTLEDLELDLDWGNLFSRRVHVNGVTLRRPSLTISTGTPHGPIRIESTATGSGGGIATNKAVTTEAPWPLAIAGLEISDGQVAWRDLAGGTEVRISGWSQEVDPENLGIILSRVAAFMENVSPTDAQVGSLGLELRTHLEEVAVSLPPDPEPLIFRDIDLRAGADFPAAADTIVFRVDLLRWSGLELTGGGTVSHRGGGYGIVSEWSPGTLRVDQLQKDIAGLLISADPHTAAWLQEAGLTLGDLTGTIASDLSWPCNDDDCADDLPASLDIRLQLRDLGLNLPESGLPARVSTSIRLTKGSLTLPDLQLAVGSGHLEARLQADHVFASQSRHAVELDFTEFPALQLIGPVGLQIRDYVEGAVNGRMQGRFTLQDGVMDPQSLDLAGRLEFRDGLVHATPLLTDISKYLGDRQDLTEIRFKTLSHEMRMRQGRYEIENLVLEGPDTDWRGQGWIAFDGRTQMNLGVKLPAGFKPDLGVLSILAETQRGEDGRIALDLNLDGMIKNPRVTLNLNPKKTMSEEDLKSGVKGFLDKLKGR